MPVLNLHIGRKRNEIPDFDPDSLGVHPGISPARRGLLSTCGNPRCGGGWLKLWRSRSVPVFEGGWCCSTECTQTQIAWALRREMEMPGSGEETRRHRIPLGLVMLEQGWITHHQLRSALAAQRAGGTGRIGQWLVHGQGVAEQWVTRALGLQSACPVLGLEGHEPESVAVFLPRLFVDAFGALPIRCVANRLLYLGFAERQDTVLALAVERMTGMRVECGLVRDSQFAPARGRMLQARFPRVELIEAVSEQVLAQELMRRIERIKPVDCRLVRVHQCYWLRMWRHLQCGPLPETDAVLDLICSLNARL